MVGSAYPGKTIESSYRNTSPTIELILSEIRNIKEDLIEQKNCIVCMKGSEVIYRIDDNDKRIADEKLEREKAIDEINKRLEKFTQMVVATLVAAILDLLGIIALFISQKPHV